MEIVSTIAGRGVIGADKLPISLLLLIALGAPLWAAQRTTLSLDGQWEIADSVEAGALPAAYSHKAPVPGLAHSAVPGFKDVDQFESRQLIQNRVAQRTRACSRRWLRMPASRGRSGTGSGTGAQFDVPALHSVATLRINKAQFGAAVWVNGEKVGEHLPCFTAAIFDVSDKLRQGANEIVVRVGAHPGVLPSTVSAGTDFEKNRWTPGIYDSVSLALSDNPAIETVQVAPSRDLQSITVQTKLRNHSAQPVAFALHAGGARMEIGCGGGARSGHDDSGWRLGEERTVTQKIAMPAAKLWTPEQPNLYVLETGTGGDTASTRFGMREFHFETATKRAYLNGRPYFMRGSNITLHRFFEDPKSGVLPWDEKWVRKLLVEIPKADALEFLPLLHRSGARPMAGHRRRGRTADPERILRVDRQRLARRRKPGPLRRRRDDRRIRRMDARQLESSRASPSGTPTTKPSIPCSAKRSSRRCADSTFRTGPGKTATTRPPARTIRWRTIPTSLAPWQQPDGPEFSMTTFEKPDGKAPGAPTGHALILNEYGWLWLNRDGSPTELTKNLYPRLLAEERHRRRPVGAECLPAGRHHGVLARLPAIRRRAPFRVPDEQRSAGLHGRSLPRRRETGTASRTSATTCRRLSRRSACT